MSFDPKFKDKISIRIWKNYFTRINRILQSVPKKQKDEMILELQGHLLESIREDETKNEPDKVLNAIEKLGEPEDFLRPIVVDKLLIDASKTLNPRSVLLGLSYNLYTNAKQAIISVCFGIVYLLLFIFSVMTLLKFFLPNHVGLLRNANGDLSFGIIASKGAEDLLGYWFIPIGILATVLLYFISTKLLRSVIKRKGNQK